ncbi:hypothetical protein I7I48_02388 [Histoplasma ohiense]|nr:hypothetical protein I7I48_02388 [Histoplasma ohiense (nom. inval.)]
MPVASNIERVHIVSRYHFLVPSRPPPDSLRRFRLCLFFAHSFAKCRLMQINSPPRTLVPPVILLILRIMLRGSLPGFNLIVCSFARLVIPDDSSNSLFRGVLDSIRT